MFKPTDRQQSLFTGARVLGAESRKRLEATWAEGFRASALPVLLKMESHFADSYDTGTGRGSWSGAGTRPGARLKIEIRRRTDVIGIFPNDPAALRLIGMLLAEQNDEWAVGRRYFSLESMATLEPATPDHQPTLEAAG